MADLLKLHAVAVKAAQKWEAATPGTRTKERLYQAWMKAEREFERACRAKGLATPSDDEWEPEDYCAAPAAEVA